MAVVTFVCDLCGTPGRADGPGTAQCRTCGQVALVEAPAEAPPAVVGRNLPPRAPAEPDPFAPPPLPATALRPGDDVDLVLEDEVVEPPPLRPRTLAKLWLPPAVEEGSTPTGVHAAPRRRGLRRALVPVAALAAGAALATGTVVAVRGGWTSSEPGAQAAGEASSAQVPAAVPAPPARAEPAPVPRGNAAAEPRGASRSRPPAQPGAKSGPTAGGGGDPAARALAGFRNPSPLDRQCVPRALRARPDLAARLPGEISARFPVAANGAVGQVEVLGDVADPEIAGAVEEAIRSCPFLPGADADGRPTPLSVVMRIRFAVR